MEVISALLSISYLNVCYCTLNSQRGFPEITFNMGLILNKVDVI